MSTRYTPGPWRVAKDGDSVVPESTNALLADVYDGSPRDTTNMEITRANAHLIAAAPDMYEALRNIRDVLTAREPAQGNYFSKINAAIAKAEGR